MRKKATNIKLKLNDFFRKNKNKILIILIIWSTVIAVNYFLKFYSIESDIRNVTYTPHTSVIDDTSSVPKKLQEPIESLIDEYFNYCNNKEYEKAYNMITKDCKNKNYPKLDDFKIYVDNIFKNKNKIYCIQNYSNIDKTYIYQIKILDDILATGTTNGYTTYEEKITILNENGDLKLSIAEYIGEKAESGFAEDEFMKIEITNKSIEYESEIYTVKFTNKTENIIVIADHMEPSEILLNLGNQTRKVTNLSFGSIVLYPNQERTTKLKFTKFYDDGVDPESLIFSAVRILNSYTGTEETRQSELDNAVKLYSLEVKLDN